MTDLDEISKRAIKLLSGILYGPPELITATLRPRPEDFAAVFVGDAAKTAADAYASFWDNPPGALSKWANAGIRVFSQLSQNIVESAEFPGGYGKIAHMLVRDQPWCRFKVVGNGGRDTIGYDGLVPLGDRWAWFPKPWRAFAAASNELVDN